MNKVKTVIMAGGKGSRLRPFTTVFPKPLMPIGDVPILDLVVRQLCHFGCADITVTTGYLAELILTYLGDGARYGIKLNYVREQVPLGTIGPLSLIPVAVEETLLVLNGDVLTTLDYRDLVRHHRLSGAWATVASFRRPVTIDKGVLTMDEQGRITGFVEKPTYYHPVAMGVYVFASQVMQYICPGVRLDAPELLQQLLRDAHHVQSYMFDGYWLDIGLPGDYERALEDFETHRASLLHEAPKAGKP